MWSEVFWGCGVVWNSREYRNSRELCGMVYGISVLGYRER